jgi:Ca2+-binding RTX toxin-like protein
MSSGFDDAIKVVFNEDGTVYRIYEFESSGWEEEDLDEDETASVEGESVLITRYDDGEAERVEIYSPLDQPFQDPDPSIAGLILFRSARLRFDGDDDDDDLDGSDYDDDLSCGRGDDIADGFSGDDSIFGDSGNDELDGGDGDDDLSGGGGRDALIGGSGTDSMSGDSGRDTFLYGHHDDSGVAKQRDVILDFRSRKDTIDLGLIDAVEGGADNAFRFIRSQPFSGIAGEVRFAAGVLSADRDGDRLADFQIQIAGGVRLLAADLVL